MVKKKSVVAEQNSDSVVGKESVKAKLSELKNTAALCMDLQECVDFGEIVSINCRIRRSPEKTFIRCLGVLDDIAKEEISQSLESMLSREKTSLQELAIEVCDPL